MGIDTGINLDRWSTGSGFLPKLGDSGSRAGNAWRRAQQASLTP